MNANNPRVGYYACTLSSLCGAALLFLVGWGRQPTSPLVVGPRIPNVSGMPPPCACPPPPRPRLPKSQSLYVPLDVEHNYREHYPQRAMNQERYCHAQCHTNLRPSKSVPEGLENHNNNSLRRPPPRRHRDVTVIEQITTSV